MTKAAYGTWRSIDTAPANEPVILYTPAGHYYGACIEIDFATPGRTRADHSYTTHWMPLPKPPQIEGE